MPASRVKELMHALTANGTVTYFHRSQRRPHITSRGGVVERTRTPNTRRLRRPFAAPLPECRQ